MKILIVEDCPDNNHLLGEALRAMGHETGSAMNGQEAWEMFRKDHFDVVISDWMMPIMTGPELCRKIRALSRSRYTYIILLTAVSGRAKYIEGLESGADDFVNKPWHPSEVAARLGVAERILRLHSRVTQLEGLLSVCAYCKKIRAEDSHWVSLDRYLAGRTGVSFSHGICPSCLPEAQGATG